MSGMSIGKFQVLGELGRGAHSTILHVLRAEDKKHYALKVVPIGGEEEKKFLTQAEHEFRVAQMLDHPHLIKVHALETEKDWFFRVRKVQLLIEYVHGKTLDDGPRMSVAHLVQVFKAVAEGLVHMHRRHVYHADLKPNNILLGRSGVVKVIDFGLAWIRGEGKDRIQGTPEYMAPEQVKHKMVNERTDLYNFGATMYRLLTFRLPPSVLPAEDGLPLDRKTWQSQLKPANLYNARVPARLADLVGRCLSYNAADRPERASEVQGELDRLCDELVLSEADRLDALSW